MVPSAMLWLSKCCQSRRTRDRGGMRRPRRCPGWISAPKCGTAREARIRIFAEHERERCVWSGRVRKDSEERGQRAVVYYQSARIHTAPAEDAQAREVEERDARHVERLPGADGVEVQCAQVGEREGGEDDEVAGAPGGDAQVQVLEVAQGAEDRFEWEYHVYWEVDPSKTQDSSAHPPWVDITTSVSRGTFDVEEQERAELRERDNPEGDGTKKCTTKAVHFVIIKETNNHGCHPDKAHPCRSLGESDKTGVA
ncbi:hypothetical protein C8R44DRAFT_744380 [Mycena epipterygia]|nr:hypothetical protein C8R44DRAFT_744380 [Mycena epipterygia]